MRDADARRGRHQDYSREFNVAAAAMGVLGFGGLCFAWGRAGRESCQDVIRDHAVELLVLQSQNPAGASMLLDRAVATDHPTWSS